MDLDLTDEQRALVASFANLLAEESTPERVRAAEPSGFDARLWTALRDVGVVEMAVPEERGGWGAALLDLALVAERVGIAAAPAPVVEAQVAARLLGRSGEQLVTLAVRPAVNGRAALVPAGAVADQVVVLDGERLLLADLTDENRTPVANLASAPLADVAIRVADATEVPGGRGAFEHALDEWLVLTAATLVGSAHRAHELACAYAVERRAWNQPIGAYQAVAHPLADARRPRSTVPGCSSRRPRGNWVRGGPTRTGSPRSRSGSRPRRPGTPPTTPCTSTVASASPSNPRCNCTTGAPAAGPASGASRALPTAGRPPRHGSGEPLDGPPAAD